MRSTEKGVAMKAAICEDEAFYAKRLKEQLAEYMQKAGEEADITVFTGGMPLLAACRDGAAFDVIFLDIQLGDADGVQIAHTLRQEGEDAAILFVTGLAERALDGYGVAAFDYIVKGDSKERLFAALDRLTKSRESGFITLPLVGGDTGIVRLRDILWIESEKRGTRVAVKGDILSSTVPVGKLSKELAEDAFTEIHKSVYVRIRAIKRIGADTVEMDGGMCLPLSRRKKKAVMSAVMRVAGGKTE